MATNPTYTPPKVWTGETNEEGRWSNPNRPIAGGTMSASST